MTGSQEGHGEEAVGGRGGRTYRRWGVVALLAFTALAAGCRQAPDPAAEAEVAVTEEEFIEMVVALREAERAVAGEDSAAAEFAERKAEIFARHGVTESDLRRFIARRGGNVDALRELWDTISDRLKHVPEGSEDPEGDDGPMPERPDVGEQRLH